MHPSLLTLALLCLQQAPAIPAAGSAASGVLVIKHANVLSATNDHWLLNQTVVVHGGRIKSVSGELDVNVPENATTIDGTDHYLIPGLIDSHTHTSNPDDFVLHLAAGVTTVWEMSGSPQHLQWREEISAGDRLGPQIYCASPLLRVEARPYLDVEVSARTPEDATRFVAGFAEDGYDFVKVWGPLPPDVYRAACAAAEKAGLQVVGHIPRDVGLESALSQGMTTVAHIEEYWNKVLQRAEDSDALADAVRVTRDADAAVITTLATYENIREVAKPNLGRLLNRAELRYIDPARRLLWGPDFNSYRRRYGEDAVTMFDVALDYQQKIAKELHDAGVPLLAGTDSGGYALSLIPGFALHDELRLLVEAGLTPAEALQAATSVPGRFLQPGSTFGVIVEGSRADLLLLSADPLQGIENTRSIVGVIANGQWIDRRELDAQLGGIANRNDAAKPIVDGLQGSGLPVMLATFSVVDLGGTEQSSLEAPLLAMAYLLHSSGKTEDAIWLLRLIERGCPRGYRASFHLAAVMRAAGDYEAARDCLRTVIERMPSHRQAHETLDDLK